MVPPEMLTPSEQDEALEQSIREMERAIEAADKAIARTLLGEEIIFDVCDAEGNQ